MSQLRVLRLRECKSVSASAFAELNAFAALQSLDMYRCFAVSLEGVCCALLLHYHCAAPEMLSPGSTYHHIFNAKGLCWCVLLVMQHESKMQVAWLWQSFHR